MPPARTTLTTNPPLREHQRKQACPIVLGHSEAATWPLFVLIRDIIEKKSETKTCIVNFHLQSTPCSQPVPPQPLVNGLAHASKMHASASHAHTLGHALHITTPTTTDQDQPPHFAPSGNAPTPPLRGPWDTGASHAPDPQPGGGVAA